MCYCSSSDLFFSFFSLSLWVNTFTWKYYDLPLFYTINVSSDVCFSVLIRLNPSQSFSCKLKTIIMFYQRSMEIVSSILKCTHYERSDTRSCCTFLFAHSLRCALKMSITWEMIDDGRQQRTVSKTIPIRLIHYIDQAICSSVTLSVALWV